MLHTTSTNTMYGQQWDVIQLHTETTKKVIIVQGLYHLLHENEVIQVESMVSLVNIARKLKINTLKPQACREDGISAVFLLATIITMEHTEDNDEVEHILHTSVYQVLQLRKLL